MRAIYQRLSQYQIQEDIDMLDIEEELKEVEELNQQDKGAVNLLLDLLPKRRQSLISILRALAVSHDQRHYRAFGALKASLYKNQWLLEKLGLQQKQEEHQSFIQKTLKEASKLSKQEMFSSYTLEKAVQPDIVPKSQDSK